MRPHKRPRRNRTRLAGPLDVAKRAILEERERVLDWVLEKWLFTHEFEPWTKTGGKRQDTCAKCGRLANDPIHRNEDLDG